ncbi:hypothetical protein BRAO285_150007 [Bradyrhizobium sp. ORS 285]|nr:hypothetical protein BRAO285_150007 [Bradyrhizobium sp. ORS 285]
MTGRQVVSWRPFMAALRHGLKDHVEGSATDLARRNIMAALDKIAQTGRVRPRGTSVSTCTPL